VNVVKVKEVN